MSYTDQTKRSSPASIAAVIGVHVAIAYALVTGLAMKVIREIPIVTVGEILPEDPPPPPPHDIPVQKTTRTPQPTTLPPVRNEEVVRPQETIVQTVSTVDLGAGPTSGPVALPVDPPKPNLSRGAVPGADRLRWITTEDYPSAALRQGISGTVVIAATIGADGKVQSCAVTQSSGSQMLDDTTCRLYARRAHFTPALDADGKAVTARRTDRFRWQIPNE
ncbi:energy transducer TonB [Sphingomonas sp. ASY06-1R]|uniref:energy transducer TonB n=1 Tax=Sphingomonas sp. ASY06-1R TaxID=3445771 RepID=UPI003FA31E49